MGISVKLQAFEGPLDLLLHLIDKNKVNIYDIPIANNLAAADFMLHSKYMNESYSRQIENFDKKVQNRVEEMK